MKMKTQFSTQKILALPFTIVMLFLSQLSYSQATISLDPTFTTGTGFDFPPEKAVVQPDGKILISGYFTSYKGLPEGGFMRLNSDGTKDLTFNLGSGFTTGWILPVSGIALQTDGKIIVGGDFSAYNGIPCNNIARLNPNGSYDTTFHSGAGFDAGPSNIAIRNDGKIVAYGGFTSYDNTARNKFVLINSDGTIDPSFDIGIGFPNTSVGSVIYCFHVQSDNKILIGGSLTTWNGNPVTNLIRLDTLGNLDNSFASTSFSAEVYSLLQQPDGKIIAGGWFQTVSGTSRSKIARINTSGTLDFTFSPGTGFSFASSLVSSDVKHMALQPDGKIVLSGKFDSFNGHPASFLARLNSNGSFDSTFNVGIGFHGSNGASAADITLQSDGKIIAFGDINDFNTASCKDVARLEGPALTSSITKNKSILPNLNVYPIPANGVINFDLNEVFTNLYSIIIVNDLGERIIQQELKSKLTQIDIRGFSKGIYFAAIQNEQGRVIRRFVKE